MMKQSLFFFVDIEVFIPVVHMISAQRPDQAGLYIKPWLSQQFKDAGGNVGFFWQLCLIVFSLAI